MVDPCFARGRYTGECALTRLTLLAQEAVAWLVAGQGKVGSLQQASLLEVPTKAVDRQRMLTVCLRLLARLAAQAVVLERGLEKVASKT